MCALAAKVWLTSARARAAEWAANGRGWLFVTSGPETQERQIPLMTLWLDLLMLTLFAGRERDERQWRALLAATGWEPTAIGRGLIEARPV